VTQPRPILVVCGVETGADSLQLYTVHVPCPCCPMVKPRAVERDGRSGRGSIRVSAQARPPTKRIISNNSYAHDDQGDNPGQENRGLDGVLYKL